MPTTATLQALARALQAHHWQLATAESCTGGLIAAACTDLPGSSAWFERGFVTYSNRAKTELLNVPAPLIETHGAVSQAVALAMARGAQAQAQTHCAIATTGIAGPEGGTPTKPVGTVWFGWCTPEASGTECQHFQGNRQAVRQQAVQHALALMLRELERPALSV